MRTGFLGETIDADDTDTLFRTARPSIFPVPDPARSGEALLNEVELAWRAA